MVLFSIVRTFVVMRILTLLEVPFIGLNLNKGEIDLTQIEKI